LANNEKEKKKEKRENVGGYEHANILMEFLS